MIQLYNGNNGIWDPQRIFHEKSFGYLYVEVSETDIRTIWKHRTAPFIFEDGGDNYDFMITSVESERQISDEYVLSQNYPNPFNPNTTIKYSIPRHVKHQTSNVKLIIYDILGREVSTLVNRGQNQGNYSCSFNASNLTSGIYFYRLQTGEFVDIKKMLLIK